MAEVPPWLVRFGEASNAAYDAFRRYRRVRSDHFLSSGERRLEEALLAAIEIRMALVESGLEGRYEAFRTIAPAGTDGLVLALEIETEFLESTVDFVERGRVDISSDSWASQFALRGARIDASSLEVATTLWEAGGEIGLIRDRLRARVLGDDAEKTSRRVDSALDAAQRTAGVASEGTLTKHFDSLARTEATTARWYIRGCVLALVLVIAAAGYTAHLGAGGELGATELGSHLLLTVSLGVAAAFLAAQSANHRHVATWARVLAVQLLTIDAFTEPLGEGGDEIRLELGRRVFSEGVPERAAKQELESTDPIATLDLLLKATELLKAAGQVGPGEAKK